MHHTRKSNGHSRDVIIGFPTAISVMTETGINRTVSSASTEAGEFRMSRLTCLPAVLTHANAPQERLAVPAHVHSESLLTP